MKPKILAQAIVDRTATLTVLDRIGISPTGEVEHISRTTACHRYLVDDIPAHQLDILIQPPIDFASLGVRQPPEMTWIVEVRNKVGRFSGNRRTRLTLRQRHAHQVRELPEFSLYRVADIITLAVADNILWSQKFEPLVLDPIDYEWMIRQQVMFYPVDLDDDEVGYCAARIEPTHSTSLANHRVATALESLCRDRGWRHLPVDRRADGQQEWERDDELAAR